MLPYATLDLRDWGPRLRYHARAGDIEAIWRDVRARLAPVVIYGSGDFHHLAAVLLRRIASPVTVISFDNHPDWDVRPPRWACGGWVNRALELPQVRRVVVWGCGNFELRLPGRWFANRRALRSDRLRVYTWAEREPQSVRRRFPSITRDDWRDRFEEFLATLRGSEVYVTVDLDCLRKEEAVTNWESGLFTAADLAWAIDRAKQEAHLLGTDVCGAYSLPKYERWFQRFAADWDHPKMAVTDRAEARRVNHAALHPILQAMA